MWPNIFDTIFLKFYSLFFKDPNNRSTTSLPLNLTLRVSHEITEVKNFIKHLFLIEFIDFLLKI